MPIDRKSIEQTLLSARRALLAARTEAGHWEGRLSSSALATATAACALALLDRARHSQRMRELADQGLAWLAEHQNDDGGWGDTVDSPSNISTTALCWAALGMDEPTTHKHRPAAQRVEAWLTRRAGDLTPANIAQAINKVYGNDRTFSTPILTMCALAGRFGAGPAAWRFVPAYPFELAACPHTWYRRLGLPVVSYALPALVAIGQVRYHHRPPFNPITRCLRFAMRGRTLRVLQSIQPESGGFLEAIPLTAFVVMSLVSAGQVDHPVVERGRAFLAASARRDGSWPIDTNLATWVTTLSVNALAVGGLADCTSTDDRDRVRTWLLDQQHKTEHPYTHSAPGGWAWTDLGGGVPDADDTAGALLALHNLAGASAPDQAAPEQVQHAARCGVRWLLDVQNKDGGVPTFCRGWGKLPFDRSTPDLTAHTLRAWGAWSELLPDDLRNRIGGAMHRAVEYLLRTQRIDGTWVPLWFGNQQSTRQENPLYGTTRVLLAGHAVRVNTTLGTRWSQALRSAENWTLSAQNADGGWGGDRSTPSTIEETALAVEALADVRNAPALEQSLFLCSDRPPSFPPCQGGMKGGRYTIPENALAVNDAIKGGYAWLIEHTDGGTCFEPTPIGLYFASLWYFEQLYPLVFTVAALERVLQSGAIIRA